MSEKKVAPENRAELIEKEKLDQRKDAITDDIDQAARTIISEDQKATQAQDTDYDRPCH